MYKNLIEKHLNNRLTEAEGKHPGVTQTELVQKQNAKVNKDAEKAVEKSMKALETSSKKSAPDSITPPKTNIEVKDGTKKYHDEIEMSEDNLDLTYDMLEVPEKFRDRVKKGVEGDSTMGNAQGGNTEPVWGASDKDFGKNLVKIKINRTKDTSQKSPGGGTNGKAAGVTHNATALAKKGKEKGATSFTTIKKKDATTESIKNNNTQITENKMKRLRFKKPFEGMNNALNLIPEHYKVDEKTFEMTDGNETYKVRWDGSLTEGKAVVLQAENKQFVNEDVNKIKHLMGYKSENTLGLVRGNARLDENKKFFNILSETKRIVESENE